METQQLKFARLLPLGEIAIRKVVVLLWSSSDALASIMNFTHSGFYTAEIRKEWRETTEDKIKEKISKLGLPQSITNQMTDIVRPVGLQIKRWLDSHRGFLSAANKDSPQLCWTTAGTINYLKTAELLCCVVEKCDHIHDVLQPCTPPRGESLENYITILWEKLSTRGVELRLHRENRDLDLTGLMLSNRLKFAFSLQRCNKTAAEYFFRKLSHKEREVILTIILRDDLLNLSNGNSPSRLGKDTSEILWYLLSLITPEQQMEMVRSRPTDILMCFFCWPWHDLFLENAGLIWTFIPPHQYGNLLQKILSYFNKDYYFPKSFREFFIESPLDFKKYFVETEVENLLKWDIPVSGTPACRFLYIFFENEDSECIEIIFKNVDAAARARLVFHDEVFGIFYKCILKDRWHLVELCLREATLCKENREKLQEYFRAFLTSKKGPKIKLRNPKWKRFFEFLDGAYTDA